MGRKLSKRDVESRDARKKLRPRGKPYWCSRIGKGLHLGYRRNKDSGVWVVRKYLGHQDYILKSIGSADDGLLEANGHEVLDYYQALEQARHERVTRGSKGEMTVREAVTAYLKKLEGQASHQDIAKRLEAFVIPAFGDRAIMSLEVEEITDWHRQLAKTPARHRAKAGEVAHRAQDMSDPEIVRCRQASANRILGMLKAALNHARRTKPKLITSNDAWHLAANFKGVDVPRSRYLTEAEARRLINACDGDFKNLVRAALETGARYQELARLRVADFNTAVGTLHIRKSKSGRDRHISLTEDGQEFFAHLAIGRGGGELLLGREWKAGQQTQPITETCQRARIEPVITFHVLRHTWASLSVMAGVPLHVVARNLGHTDTKMVERVYGHLAPSYLSSEIKARAPRFGSVRTNVKAI